MTTEWSASGDAELDAVRHDVAAQPTEEATLAPRLAALATWVHLLQRQGLDLTSFVPAHDEIVATHKAGDDAALYAAVDAAFAELGVLQAERPSIADWVNEPSLGLQGARLVRQQPRDAGPVPMPGVATPHDGRPEQWPVYGGNTRHTSSTDYPGPEQGEIAWKKAIGLAWYGRPGVDSTNARVRRVYVPSPGIRGMLDCLDLATGAVIWRLRREWTRDRLGSLRPFPSCYTTPSVSTSPLVLGDRVVLNEIGAQGRGFGARHLTVVDQAADAVAATGRCLKHLPAGQADYRLGYVSLTGNEDVAVYLDGIQRISTVPPHHIGQHRAADAVAVVCQRLADGKILWDMHIGPAFAEPVLDGEGVDTRAYVGTADGVLLALNIAGESDTPTFGYSDTSRVAWSARLGGACNSSPAVAAHRVVVGTNDGRVVALDKASGRVLWSTETGPVEPRAFKLFSKPAICAAADAGQGERARSPCLHWLGRTLRGLPGLGGWPPVLDC